MQMAKYTDILQELRLKKGISFKELGETLNKHPQTVRDSFESKNVSSIIDLLNELGIIMVDDEGKNIFTGEKISKSIQIGKYSFTPEELKELKKLLR